MPWSVELSHLMCRTKCGTGWRKRNSCCTRGWHKGQRYIWE